MTALEGYVSSADDTAPSSSANGYPRQLTGREVAVLRLLVAGRDCQQISAELVVSLSSVRVAQRRALLKLGCSNRVEFVPLAWDRYQRFQERDHGFGDSTGIEDGPAH